MTKVSARNIRILVFLLTFIVAVKHSQAEGTNGSLPERFTRIYRADQLTADGIYLIGAVHTLRDEKPCLVLLSSTLKKDWLMGINMGAADALAGDMTTGNARLMWRVVKNDDGVVLQSVDDDRYVYCADADKVKTELSVKESTVWRLIDKDGIFNLVNADRKSRSLSLYWNNEYHFGNYSSFDTDALCIYKGVSGEEIEEEAWPLPANGANVALVAKNTVATADLTGTDVATLLLSDGTLARSEGVGLWTFAISSDTCFTLSNTAGEFLNYELRSDKEICLWRILNGKISTCEPHPRHLYYNINDYLLLSPDAIAGADAQDAVPVRLLLFAEEAEADLKDGLLTLRGGWGSTALASLDWDGVNGLDMTAISLPVLLKDFECRPQPANTVVYVHPEAAESIPQTWNFVVVKDGDNARLLTPTVLADKETLRLHCDVSFTDGLLSYERKAYADGGWETIFLPFSAELPADFAAAVCPRESDEELQYTLVRKIEAYTPAILRYTGTPNEKGITLELHAESGKLLRQNVKDDTELFCGTTERFRISSAAENVYLLNATGDTFVCSDAGSTQLPFRAFLRMPDNRKSMRLKPLLKNH